MATPDRSRLTVAAAVATMAALISLSLLLRLPVFDYHGPRSPHPFNLYLMDHVGAYTDIAHLYFRDQLWQHPAPYLDYRFEYPVLTGAFVWLASLGHPGVGQYLLVSTAMLVCLGAIAVWVVGRIEGANRWVLAAAPALAFYAVLNWDLLGVCLLAVALLLFLRGRDLPASAVLALSVSAKLFPVVVLPVVLALRVADRRVRSALGIAGVFAVVTLLVNVPIALDPAAPDLVRANWLHFFTFTLSRPPKATLWQPALGPGADLVTDPLFVAGLLAIVMLAVRNRARPGGSLIPASCAALLWVFATAKVYSPQYALWIFAALAIDGAPLGLVVAFGLVDVLVFATTFGPLYPGLPIVGVQWTVYGLRQVLTVALVVWIVREQLIRRPHPNAAPAYSLA
ncbi:MAG: hypothetical protein M3155_05255 [Actinomycetota bacterium]|nr:hypothetical protein [Actinomycetota bacterium]